MTWVVVGAVLALLGAAGVVGALRGARTQAQGAAGGLVLGCSGGLLLWGVVVVVVALVLSR